MFGFLFVELLSAGTCHEACRFQLAVRTRQSDLKHRAKRIRVFRDFLVTGTSCRWPSSRRAGSMSAKVPVASLMQMISIKVEYVNKTI